MPCLGVRNRVMIKVKDRVMVRIRLQQLIIISIVISVTYFFRLILRLYNIGTRISQSMCCTDFYTAERNGPSL